MRQYCEGNSFEYFIVYSEAQKHQKAILYIHRENFGNIK